MGVRVEGMETEETHQSKVALVDAGALSWSMMSIAEMRISSSMFLMRDPRQKTYPIGPCAHITFGVHFGPKVRI